MKITLLTVGKTDVRWVREGLDLYVSRLKHYVPFVLNEIPELKNVSALSQDQIKEREGDLVLAALKPGDEVYLLNEGRILLYSHHVAEAFECFARIGDDTIVVFELSCHQLDHLKVSPHVAVFLNLYEEHLDHYGTLERYFEAKANIAAHQCAGDLFLVGEQVPPIGTAAQVRVLTQQAEDGWEPFSMKLEGAHNQFNARVVYEIATTLYGCSDAAVRAALAEFSGLPHRLQLVGSVDGVDYYDDSISTIPEATIAAMRSIPNAHTVLVGGMDRGIDYDKLVEFVRANQGYRYIFMYATGKRIFDEVADLPCCSYVDDLAAAVALAKEATPAGGACLLSPAAASYGYFKNFEERGDVFRALVLDGQS